MTSPQVSVCGMMNSIMMPVTMHAEAEKEQQVLKAQGEAQAILAVAAAQAEALRQVGEAANTDEGQKAIQLDLATKAIEAKQAIARESTIVLLPDQGTDAASVVAQAMTIINAMNREAGSNNSSAPNTTRGGSSNGMANR